MRKLTIGTRGSALALWQAEHVAGRLRQTDAAPDVELQIIKTRGDKILDVPLAKVGGKGLFVKEIEEALRRREIDLAVHSMKDVPSVLAPGLILSGVPEREDARDALISRAGVLADLPEGANVGTSSLRRGCQLLGLRPDLTLQNLRGNVDTRLRKLEEGQYDAIVLAAAGLKRLGLQDRITELLSPEVMLPAVGQGALGIETRQDDAELNELVRSCLHHESTAARVAAERGFLERLGGGCQVPVAAHAWYGDGGGLRMDALIGHPSGEPMYRQGAEVGQGSPEAMGQALARRLLDMGGDVVLKEVCE